MFLLDFITQIFKMIQKTLLAILNIRLKIDVTY